MKEPEAQAAAVTVGYVTVGLSPGGAGAARPEDELGAEAGGGGAGEKEGGTAQDFSVSFSRWQEGASSSSRPTRRKKKRKKKKLPRGGTRLQRAYAKVTGLHCSSSSCSGACGKQVLQDSATALEATPFSVFVRRFGCLCLLSTGGLAYSFFITYVQRLTEGAMACASLCGQGLWSRSPCPGAEVEAAEFLGPCTQVQGRGQLSDSWPRIRCTRTGGWTDTHTVNAQPQQPRA